MALEPPVLGGDRFHRAAEADLEGAFAALELPGVAVIEPGLGQLDLPAVGDLLAEHAVDIADAVAMRRHVDRRHALHEAGGEPAEAAIAERRIRLERGDDVDVDAERRQRLAHGCPAGRDWRRRRASGGRSGTPATDSRRAFPAGRRPPWSTHPVVDDAVAHDLDRGGQPVVLGRDRRVLADPVFAGPSRSSAASVLGSGFSRMALGVRMSSRCVMLPLLCGCGRRPAPACSPFLSCLKLVHLPVRFSID